MACSKLREIGKHSLDALEIIYSHFKDEEKKSLNKILSEFESQLRGKGRKEPKLKDKKRSAKEKKELRFANLLKRMEDKLHAFETRKHNFGDELGHLNHLPMIGDFAKMDIDGLISSHVDICLAQEDMQITTNIYHFARYVLKYLFL
jgi:hypothetical protein